MQLANIILPRLREMWQRLSASCVLSWFYLCVWSTSSRPALFSPTVLSHCRLHQSLPSRRWSIQACHPANAPRRALLCVLEVRGIKAATNIYSAERCVRPSQWRRNREHEQIKQSLSMIVSPGCLSPRRIITRVLLILKAGGNFSLLLPNWRLITEPVAEICAVAGQRQREYTLYEYLDTSALPLAGAIRETPGNAVEG